MGFLGFIKKKEDSAPTGDTLDIPLPPPKQGSNDSLPNFADEGQIDELKLPDISELDTPTPVNEVAAPSYNIPENNIPAQDKIEELKASPEYSEPEPPKVPDISELSETFNGYEHTPSRPINKLFPTHEVPRGDVFIKGEDYRDVIEGLDEIISKNKGKTPEKDTFLAEEKELDRFEAGLEDLQRSLIVAEKNIFD